MSQYHALLGNTSSIGANIIYTPDESNIKPGEDFVVYDKFEDKYKALRGHSYEEMSFDAERYETNWDVIIGHNDGITHAVAKDDAYNQTDTVQDDTAAAPCYYRIEIDNTQDGGFHYNLYSHDRQEGDVSWSANDTMQSILNKISVPSYSGKAVLNDGTGIGIYLGGYSSNTCRITNITGTVTVVDMSQFATEDDYSETEYKGSEQYSIRPTADGVLANKPGFDGNGNAEIVKIEGNSVVWNQIVKNANFIYGYQNFVNYFSTTVSIKENEFIICANEYRGNVLQNLKLKLLHEYLFLSECKSTSNRIVLSSYGILRNGADARYHSGSNNFELLYAFGQRVSEDNIPNIAIVDERNENFDNITIKYFKVIDLTQMFGAGNEPTTYEEFLARKPKVEDEFAYNEGDIVNVNVDGFKTVGFNLWDEEWEKYALNYYTGKIITDTPNDIHSKNYIKIFPNTNYYIKSPKPIVICGYDVNYNYVRGLHYNSGNMMFNTKECNYIKFGTFNNYGATYNNDICINLSWSGYRNGDYEAYNEHNINIPVKEIKDTYNNILFPDGLCGIGSVKDEVTNNKAVKRWKKFIVPEQINGSGYNYDIYIGVYILNLIPEVCNRASYINTIFGQPNNNAFCWIGVDNTLMYFLFSKDEAKKLNIINTEETEIDIPKFNTWWSGLSESDRTFYYLSPTPIEVNFKDVPQSFGDKLKLNYISDQYGTEEFLYDNEDIKVPSSTINRYESHMYASAPYTEKNQKINGSFKNWRGVSVRTILGSSKIPVGLNSSCLCNTNQNYSYRSGANFSGWKSWASTNGVTKFTTDGVNGTVNNSADVVMSQSTFNSNVNNTFAESSENYKMYDYYNRLLNSEGNEFAYLHNQYVERYGTMSTLYDAYLMSHMVNTDNPSSGITYTAMNMGKQLTDVKGRVMAVDYNYNYVPAYPPEYNALHYGVSNKDSMFSKGRYCHPEVYDLGLMFRDDIMQKCNTTWSKIKGLKYTVLANNMYSGSCAEYGNYNTWNFHGTTRCINASHGYNGYFRSRPVLAFETF